jgi:hypothetical protein
MLSHVRVASSAIAVHVGGGHAELSHCQIDTSTQLGLQVERGAELMLDEVEFAPGHRVGVQCEPASLLQMTNCRIACPLTYGIALREVQRETLVRDTIVGNAGWDGILVRGSCSPTIERCEIVDNDGNGIRCIAGASPAILDNRIIGSGMVGVRLEERWSGALRGNTVRENGAGGIEGEVRCSGEITGNRIERNRRFGLRLALDCTCAVTGNTFIENQASGLVIENARPQPIERNAFADNLEYALRNESSNDIEAANNWWNATREDQIEALIYDGQDETNFGRVQFRPWLSARPTANSPLDMR